LDSHRCLDGLIVFVRRPRHDELRPSVPQLWSCSIKDRTALAVHVAFRARRVPAAIVRRMSGRQQLSNASRRCRAGS
jgi:hypothetical protein